MRVTDRRDTICDKNITTFDDARGNKCSFEASYRSRGTNEFFAAQLNDVDGARTALDSQQSSAVSRYFPCTLHYNEQCVTLVEL